MLVEINTLSQNCCCRKQLPSLPSPESSHSLVSAGMKLFCQRLLCEWLIPTSCKDNWPVKGKHPAGHWQDNIILSIHFTSCKDKSVLASPEMQLLLNTQIFYITEVPALFLKLTELLKMFCEVQKKNMNCYNLPPISFNLHCRALMQATSSADSEQRTWPSKCQPFLKASILKVCKLPCNITMYSSYVTNDGWF